MNLAVLGAGSWGTTLALHLARQGHPVRLWDGSEGHLEVLERDRENRRHVPGSKFPAALRVEHSLAECVSGPGIVFALPSQATRSVVRQVAVANSTWGGIAVSASKGFEEGSGARMSQVLAQTLPGPARSRVVVLAGPSLAREVAAGLPVTLVAAGPEPESREVQEWFMGGNVRVYTNPDPMGVELAGALKNVIAIASGLVDGLRLGDNARGALLSRGLAEMVRLGTALGARAESFYGLCGVGDLVTTCVSGLSRNHRVGVALAGGQKLDAILDELGMVAEGVPTARAALAMARAAGVEMPITEQVHDVLFAGKDPRVALEELMSRGRKAEIGPGA